MPFSRQDAKYAKNFFAFFASLREMLWSVRLEWFTGP